MPKVTYADLADLAAQVLFPCVKIITLLRLVKSAAQ